MRKSLLTIAAASMVAGSTIAQAAPMADVRDAAPVAEVEGLAGEEGTTIIPIILGVAALIALLLLTGDDEEDEGPFSP